MTRVRRGSGPGRDGRLVAFALAAVSSAGAAAILRRNPPGGEDRWTRLNHAGRPVTLLEGPSYAVGAVAGALAGGAGGPAAAAGLAAGVFGAIDDHAGDSSRKGLRGHLAAARGGEVTTGVVKIAGLAGSGVLSAWMVDRTRRPATPSGRRPRSRPISTLVGGAVIAGSANIVNLLDLRPGRALKVVLLLATPIVAGGRGAHGSPGGIIAAAAAGAAVAALPDDLGGRSMLGDTGANSSGALLGTALVARTGLRGRLLALALLTLLTLASENVSFTRVIESTPGLRELDGWGRPQRSSASASSLAAASTTPA